jgi:hypothetical protein
MQLFGSDFEAGIARKQPKKLNPTECDMPGSKKLMADG